MVTYGVLFISSSPSIAVTLMVLVPNSHLLVVAVLSAFTWCVAMMLAAVVWRAVVPLQAKTEWSIWLAVTAQELLRLGLHRVFLQLSKRGEGVQALLRPGAQNDIFSGLAVGAGYALLASLVNFFTTVSDNFASSSAIYVENCRINFIVASASNALALNILHICLGVLLWPKYSNRDWALQAFITYAFHLAIAEATTSWANPKVQCTGEIGIVFSLVFVVFVYTVIASIRSLKKESR